MLNGYQNSNYSLSIISNIRVLHNFFDNDYFMGFIYLSLGFSVSINDWVKFFKINNHHY